MIELFIQCIVVGMEQVIPMNRMMNLSVKLLHNSFMMMAHHIGNKNTTIEQTIAIMADVTFIFYVPPTFNEWRATLRLNLRPV
ncbi:MAG: hypothetical protein K9M45_12675 [Kiritimatiellales bacterium]|nr:hypothetical protein [Kiritimatiellales bacterium]